MDASCMEGSHVKIYIAASHPRFEQAENFALMARTAKIDVTSHWHSQPDKESYTPKDPTKLPKIMEGASERDLWEVKSADILVVITGDTLTKGGRHAEVGIALGEGKEVLLIGPREMVFHYHPRVVQFHSEASCLAYLIARALP